MQLSLRDLVAYQCKNYNKPSVVPLRMLPLPSTLVDREEKIRAYWVMELINGASTMGASWNVSLSRPTPEGTGLFPCNNAIWMLPEFDALLSSDMGCSIALYIELTTQEIWFVHNL